MYSINENYGYHLHYSNKVRVKERGGGSKLNKITLNYNRVAFRIDVINVLGVKYLTPSLLLCISI
jgi:hypothetical protein